ncbi:TPA: hypothetical protein DD449_01005 [Candidatus Berkelbacteria bacterium]|uniref:Uncharacterized protein n=1 Tax=Berkelbacteria bacterium GW2011_GWE1_39_12 TaxID=1618337 RepID=A0A0G4B5F9_9BACT|nr:MAG: hypothetical protein UT28_C0001G0886 [Berkelbacteria bacterium GW2011_GWE1_39_12]HBO60250.1 hypothetical protein [Candidatus Berkelbacteria bacterium]
MANAITDEQLGHLFRRFEDLVRRLRGGSLRFDRAMEQIQSITTSPKATFLKGAWCGIDFEMYYDSVGCFFLGENPEKKILVGLKYIEKTDEIKFGFHDNYLPTDEEKSCLEKISTYSIIPHAKKVELTEEGRIIFNGEMIEPES